MEARRDGGKRKSEDERVERQIDGGGKEERR